MPAVTIRNLPEETHRALKARAARHGRSTEAEIRAILESAVHPTERVKLGSALAAIGREFGGVDLDIARDKTPARTVTFECGAADLSLEGVRVARRRLATRTC